MTKKKSSKILYTVYPPSLAVNIEHHQFCQLSDLVADTLQLCSSHD